MTSEYITQVLASPAAYLCTTFAPFGHPAAAGILVESDGWLHYFLAGTADEFLDQAPSKNVLMHMVSIAVERNLPLNLGGGLVPGDGLDLFKQGFANRTANFCTSDTVTNSQAYAALCAGGQSIGFFPAYRTPDDVPLRASSVRL